ncbi:hypothetical protein L5515_010037 [Caenorhabditis briggsae]|uniref:Transmembrane protein n=1 Tax=Caenorhabditis briggsae TaxID=6238 RepID=A0AAE9JCP1_CAEBR|nr:hypothetical protein L5515_010037 [Caenorhabditis briggsae]
MYFWVKTCAIADPKLKTTEEDVSSEAANTDGDDVKIKFYLTMFLLLLLSPLSVYFVNAGVMKSCRAEPKLPFWMVIIGSCLLFEIIACAFIGYRNFLNHRNNSKCPSEGANGYRPAFLIILRISVRLSIFGLSIVGFLWSCSVVSQESDCSDFIIWPSFILSFMILLLSTFAFIYYSCVLCCTILDYFEEEDKLEK